MRTSHAGAISALAALLAACGSGASDQGTIRIASSAQGLSTELVCAHYTLTPYQLSPDGSATAAGPSVSFNSWQSSDPNAAPYTDAVLDCTAGPVDGDGYNWEYQVVVDDFSTCGSTPGTIGAAVPGVSLSESLNVPVRCLAGAQVDLPISTQVSIASPNQGGYLDISSGVTVTNAAAGSAPVCARFTAQPYAPAADGTPQPIITPSVWTSVAANANGVSGYTDQILGCIDSPADSGGYNWGFLVTVDSFTTCPDDSGAPVTPLGNIAPSSLTLNIPADCQAAIDTDVVINAPVMQTP